jgi:hypothetical protein
MKPIPSLPLLLKEREIIVLSALPMRLLRQKWLKNRMDIALTYLNRSLK